MASLGVHINVLLEMSSEYPGKRTEEVCALFVKPQTAKKRCAYIHLLQDAKLPDGTPLVAPATCFVSHAWKCQMHDVVDCMVQHSEKNPGSYFWFDLVTNNQHEATNANSFEWWCTTFRESIKAIGSVLLVMTPWDNPIPLTRVW
jgi:hypothetical protein